MILVRNFWIKSFYFKNKYKLTVQNAKYFSVNDNCMFSFDYVCEKLKDKIIIDSTSFADSQQKSLISVS